MLSRAEATKLVETQMAGAKVKACIPWKGNRLVRVEHDLAEERDFDPFFLVMSSTREVLEFSVMTDGDPGEIADAFENDNGID
jgi:hypothetical protein